MDGHDATAPVTGAATDADSGSPSLLREVGRLRAEVFDLGLRYRESCHVIEVLAGRQGHGRGQGKGASPGGGNHDPVLTSRLRELLCHHLRFCRALEGSWPWRLVRALEPERWRPPPATRLQSADAAALDEQALDDDLREISEYVRRVLESRRWHMIQRIRRLVGRAW